MSGNRASGAIEAQRIVSMIGGGSAPTSSEAMPPQMAGSDEDENAVSHLRTKTVETI